MLKNNDITYYHKIHENGFTAWERYVFKDIWLFGKRGSIQNEGYEQSNGVDVRIPLDKISDMDIFTIEDLIAVGIHKPIQKQKDLKGTEMYVVTSVKINNFGNTPHVHLGGN